MGKLQKSWTDLITQRGDTVAVTIAESGESKTFRELDHAAEALLRRDPALARSSGRIWAFTVKSPMDWLSIYLAALKIGAIAMPIEEVGRGGVNHEQLLELGVSYCLTDQGLETFSKGRILQRGHLIKLTSGTTGKPKALLFTEEEMAADGLVIMRGMGISKDDRNYGVIPLGHAYGLGNLLMPLILAGTSLVIGSSPFPQVMAEEIAHYACTVFPAVPAMIKALTDVDIAEGSLKSLQLVISAGSMLAPELARKFYQTHGKYVHNFYGSSETGAICFDPTGDYTLSGEAVGEVIEGVTLHVDEDGRIFVDSDAICREVRGEHGCLMNDFGELGENGQLKLIGRQADFIKLAGKRLFLTEVEQALCRLDEVEDAYVSHRPRRNGEVTLVALVQSEQSGAAIKEALREDLPEWKIPKRIYQVQAIPYTDRGKKDRDALLAMLADLT